MGHNAQTNEDDRPWRARYRPYIVAIVLAFVLTMFVAPEVNEGDGMEPTIKEGQVLLTTKVSYSAKRGIPDLGQIVILDKTLAPALSADNIIARVVGLPGDTLEISDGKIYRNEKEYITDDGIAAVDGDMKVTVSEKDVFVLCDNRQKKVDSRNKKLGPVDMNRIKGNVKFIIWPLSDIGGVH